MQRFVCVHGHFYQPPREDPWTRKLPKEKSASPFHDWNERITSECYAPNLSSPLLDSRGKVIGRENNYSWISFDFGPTLLRWLETKHPKVHDGIVEADRQSAERFGGHGSAMAQVYNHMIMPLASPRDRRRQVRWGIADFVRRFGRPPEGMWLSETAVDLDSLEALAENGIRFTILSPDQASAVRNAGDEGWTDVSGGRVNPRRAYFCRLPSGKTIGLFFFDKGLSTNLAFGTAMDSGDALASALARGFVDDEELQLVNVATDGETFGHHRRMGHASLTGCISRMESTKQAALTNYGLFLSTVPPRWEARIIEDTSWSCPHGVERWRSNCGCGSEIHPGFNQKWRTPLRNAMDWLAEQISQVYEAEAARVFKDKEVAIDWLATVRVENRKELDKYIRENLKDRRAGPRGSELIQMVESAELMLASCAWFWEDIARIETRNMLRFSARAIELARDSGGPDLEREFRHRLFGAIPNDRRFKTGEELYVGLSKRSK